MSNGERDQTGDFPITQEARDAFVAVMGDSPKFRAAIDNLKARIAAGDPGDIVAFDEESA